MLQVELKSCYWAEDLLELGNLHDYLVELEVVSTKAEVTVSSAWVVNRIKGFDKSLGMVEVHTGPDFPSLDFAVGRKFVEVTGRANRVSGVVGFAMDKHCFRSFAPLR